MKTFQDQVPISIHRDRNILKEIGQYMTDHDLAPCVARSSAPMVLSLYGNQILAFHEEGFQLPKQFAVLKMMRYLNIPSSL